MSEPFSDIELEAYLDEALTGDVLAKIEDAVRHDPALARRLAAVNARRDAGVHSLGEIWRRQRLTCLGRSELGSYLLGVLPADRQDYVTFHLEKVLCRYCLANLDDLRRQQAEQDQAKLARRRKYFESSAGLLTQRSN